MTDSYQQSLSEQMRENETKELLEIWNAQDLEAWTPEAFEIVRSIILERLGTVPEPESILIHMLLDDNEKEEEEENDLIYKPKQLIGLTVTASKAAWVILGLFILHAVGLIIRLAITSWGTYMDPITFIINVLAICGSFAPGLFFFFVLRILPELAFLWMDIESNGRKTNQIISLLGNK